MRAGGHNAIGLEDWVQCCQLLDGRASTRPVICCDRVAGDVGEGGYFAIPESGILGGHGALLDSVATHPYVDG